MKERLQRSRETDRNYNRFNEGKKFEIRIDKEMLFEFD